MRKNLLVAWSLVVFSVCVFSLTVKTGQAGRIKPVAPLQSSATGSSFSFGLGELEISRVGTKDGNFTRVTGLDGDRTAEIGMPDLPSVSFLVEIPCGVNPKISISDVSYREYDLKAMGFEDAVQPRQPSVVKLEGAKPVFTINKDFYGSDCFYPQETALLEGEAFIRSHRVVPVTVNPVQYNPARHLLRVYESFTISVKTEGGSFAGSISEREKKYSSSYESYLKGKIINYESIYGSSPKTSYNDGILMITTAAFNTADLANYAEFKRKWGYKVKVATLAETGTTSSAIKSYIQNAYNTWTNPSLGFVILVGDYENITATDMTAPDSATKTDLYYTTLAGGDILPDIHLARLTVDDTTELSTVLTRLTSYSLGNFTSTAWIDKISFLGTCDTGFNDIAEGTHNYCVTNFTSPWGYAGNFPNNPQAGGDKLYCVTYNASNQNCIDRFNEGRSIVTHSGHCGPTYFAGPYIYVSDVQGLTNGEMTPFVVGHCCQSNQWEGSTLTVGEAWLKEAAVGYWGSVDYTYWDEDDLLQKDWYNEVYVNSHYRVGEFTDLAKIDFFNNNGGSSLVTYYMEEYNLNGDPTLEIWTKQPGTLTVAHDPAFLIGATSYQVTVTASGSPVAGALVCLYKADEGIHEVAATNASGVATVSLNPSASSTGTMSLMVTKHDYKPYQASLSVIAPDGPYIVYSSRGAISEVTGDGDSYYEPGEKYSVSVVLANFGSEDATNVTASLSGNGVEMCSPAMSFGDIPVGGTGSATFEFVIDQDFSPCGGSAGFDLTAKSCAELTPAGSDEYDKFGITVGQEAPGATADIAIQPPAADTYINEASAGTNYGTATTMFVQRRDKQNRRALVRFDLSSIPAGSTINTAQLELYCTAVPSTGQTLNIHYLTSSWSETGATWNNMNAGYDSTMRSFIPAGTSTGWKTWTGLAQVVQGWVGGAIPNNGLMVKNNSETGTTTLAYQFASNNYATTGYRPILRVNYTAPNSWVCTYVGAGACDPCAAPSQPVITGIVDISASELSGIRVNYTPGSPAVQHDLYRNGTLVVSNYASGAVYLPGDNSAYTYVVKAVNGECQADSAGAQGTDADAMLTAPGLEVLEASWSASSIGWPATDAANYRVLRGLRENLAALDSASQDFSCHSFGSSLTVDISGDDPSGVDGRCFYYLVQGYNGSDPDLYLGPAGNSTLGPRSIETPSACD